MTGWSGTSALGIVASATELDTVERQLAAGERVEWVGRPDPRRRFSSADAKLVPMGLAGLAFGIWWEVGAMQAPNDGWVVGIVGLSFVALTGYTAFGRFFYKAYRRRRTVYAVTNRRVLSIVRGGSGESVDAAYLDSIPNVSTSVGPDGKGSVEFGLSPQLPGEYRNTGMELLTFGHRSQPGVAFYDVDDPGAVAALVERLRREDRSD